MNMVKNLTEGRPLNLLFFFALPMVAGNLFQQLYNMVDTAVVGKFVGEDCGATSFLRNSDKIYEKKRNASQAPGRRFWPSAAARTRTRSWRPLWTRWWPPDH